MGEVIHWNLRGIKDKRNINYKKKIDIVSQTLFSTRNLAALNLQ